MPFEFRINLNKIYMLGKISKIGKIQAFFDWEAACIRLSVYPDEMQHDAAFHLGLHCLPKYSFRGFQNANS